ncbi:hypothetical protein VTI74DRAFT_10061 [Chaetomium olivicolor]
MAGPDSDRAATLPLPPFIYAPGLDNLRDAGGYPIKSKPGKAIRRGILYRSAHLNKLEDDGVATLQGLGIAKVFDLRSVVEVAKAGGEQAQQLLPAVPRVFVPVFLDKDYSPEALALRFRHYSDGPELSLNFLLPRMAAIRLLCISPDQRAGLGKDVSPQKLVCNGLCGKGRANMQQRLSWHAVDDTRPKTHPAVCPPPCLMSPLDALR